MANPMSLASTLATSTEQARDATRSCGGAARACACVHGVRGALAILVPPPRLTLQHAAAMPMRTQRQDAVRVAKSLKVRADGPRALGRKGGS